LFAYTVPFAEMLQHAGPGSKPWVTW